MRTISGARGSQLCAVDGNGRCGSCNPKPPTPMFRGGPAGPRPIEEVLVSNVVVKSPMQYLDKATTTLRELGLMPSKVEDAPINGLLQKISDLDQDRIA